jgi:FKBP-type peptidyl-prolyl cis-trans isomerase
MKKIILLGALALTLFAFSTESFAQKKNKKDKDAISFTSKTDTISYLIGSDIGKSFSKNSIEVTPKIFLQGLLDGLSGNDSSYFSQAASDSLMKAFQQDLMKKQEEKNKLIADENKKAGSAFLAENAKKEGVTTLPSGLQYKVTKEGTGDNPKPTDKVTVHYKGTLIDGKVFDSSIDRGQPASFQLNRVIKGWTEGLQLMKPGGKAILYIPSELGYGDRTTPTIPGGSTLIFEVELISIAPPPPPAPDKTQITPEKPQTVTPIEVAPAKEPTKTPAKVKTIKPKK